MSYTKNTQSFYNNKFIPKMFAKKDLPGSFPNIDKKSVEKAPTSTIAYLFEALTNNIYSSKSNLK